MSRRMVIMAILAAAGCGFDAGTPFFGGDSNADAGVSADADQEAPPPDAATDATGDIAHLPPNQWFGGSADLIIPQDGVVTMDTTTLLIDGASGIVLVPTLQSSPGTDVAVLRVRSFTMGERSQLLLQGHRPLLVIATDTVEIDGFISASANMARPGPGGALYAGGPGAGGQGEHKSFRDGGGGGGGFGGAGANGGDATTLGSGDADGGSGGGTYLTPTLELLTGGSGGGYDGLLCSGLPGAGGGAIQLYSFTSIVISGNGAINAGGGGGGPGRECPSGGDYVQGGGTGGGSGGAIYLQAPKVTVQGRLAANGGGGGGGAGEFGEGSAGQNGRVTSVALGGSDAGEFSSRGGDGGFGGTPPEEGREEFSGSGNAGGGGGGFGRIVVSTKLGGLNLDADRSSPKAAEINY